MTAHRRSSVAPQAVLPVFQFVPDDGGKITLLKSAGRMSIWPRHDQIVDGAGVGNDQLHPSESEALQILNITAHILSGDICLDLMGHQKSIQFIAGFQTKKTAQLRLRYALRLIFLKGEAFQNPAR